MSSLGRALTLVHTGEVSTRAELTGRLGLTRGAVGSILAQLVSAGLVAVDRHPSTASVGRPSHRIATHPDGPVVLAAQLHVDTVTVGVVGLGGTIRTLVDAPLPSPSDPDVALDAITDLAVAQLSDLDRACLGLGVAVPSAIDDRSGEALAAHHLGWPSVTPVRQPLLDRLTACGLPIPVTVGNDANLAALAEHRRGSGRGAGHLLYMTTGQQGVGGGLLVDGRLHTGSSGYALEVGHLTVQPLGRPCACGNRGCLDAETDTTALLAAAGRPAAGGAAAYREALDLLATISTDPIVAAAVRQLIEALGTGLASLINVLNPDRVVLGGLHAALLAADPAGLTEVIATRSFLGAGSRIPVTAGQLDRAALLGAAELALEPFLRDPRTPPARCRPVSLDQAAP
jgi:predicted NBD/HSP70 family sugar kinase